MSTAVRHAPSISLLDPGRRVGRERWVAVAAAATAVWIACYAFWIAVGLAGARGTQLFTDIAYLLPIAVASGMAFLAAWRAPPGLRVFWALVGVACTSWFAGELLWSARDLATGSVPFPWWTDALYVWFYPLLGLGLLWTLRPQLASVGAGRLLDAALAVGSLALLWWWLVLRPLPLSLDLTSAAALVGPAFALLLLGLLVASRLLPRREGTLGTSIVALGLLVGTVNDGLYTHAAVTHSYVDGSWADLGWQIEALLYALGALVTVIGLDALPDWKRIREPNRSSVLAIVGGLGVGVAGLALSTAHSDLSAFGAAAAAVLVGLAIARALILARARRLPQPPGAFQGKLGPLQLHDELARLIQRSRAVELPVALLLADTDGWLDPDDTLPDRLAACARREDGLVDLGSGRFGMLLPGADETMATRIASGVRRELALAGRVGRVATAVAAPEDEAEALIARTRARLLAPAPSGTRT